MDLRERIVRLELEMVAVRTRQQSQSDHIGHIHSRLHEIALQWLEIKAVATSLDSLKRGLKIVTTIGRWIKSLAMYLTAVVLFGLVASGQMTVQQAVALFGRVIGAH